MIINHYFAGSDVKNMPMLAALCRTYMHVPTTHTFEHFDGYIFLTNSVQETLI